MSIIVLIDQQLLNYVLINTSIIVLIDQQLFGGEWDQRRRSKITGVLIST